MDKNKILNYHLVKKKIIRISLQIIEANLIDDYYNIQGTFIPAYTLNTFLTELPIVGDIITAGSPEEGIIAANYKVQTKMKELDISFNPISVLVPNIIKNFLEIGKKDDVN